MPTRAAGDTDKYNAMIDWAKTLTMSEKKAFNDAIESRDANRAKLAVSGLYAKYVAADGSAPNLINGKNNVNGGAKPTLGGRALDQCQSSHSRAHRQK
jgi:hypothetical protein